MHVIAKNKTFPNFWLLWFIETEKGIHLGATSNIDIDLKLYAY